MPPNLSSPPSRYLAAAVALAAVLVAAALLSARPEDGRDFALSLLLGAGFGIVLQRARFCFLCNFRDYVDARDARGLIAILVALAVGTLGYAAIFGAWLPVPSPERLPPDAHIGPVSPALVLAAFVFGLGMAISGSCLSAHFYRLGEGSPTAPFALIGAAAGFVAGFLTWNSLYLLTIAEAKPVWLPHHLGYAGWLLATLGTLGALALLLLWRSRAAPPTGEAETRPPLAAALRALFVARWPGAVGGILVGLIGTVAYFRVVPLGVTAELASLSRTGAAALGLLPETLHGLDSFRGCVSVLKQGLLSNNGLFVIGLVGGSFSAALAAGQFRPARPSPAQIGNGLLGGFLMGWGAMIALGCTVGVLLSGIQAGALAGWVFLPAAAIGAWTGLKVKRRIAA